MKIKKRPCRHCYTPFTPDKYNHHKQEYCTQSECRRAAAREKRAKYRRKKKWNLEFRADEVKRVQQWRLNNPGYSQKKEKPDEEASTPSASKDSAVDLKIDDLRDLVIRQELILVGMASQWVGSTLEDVESFILSCCNTGRQFTPFLDFADTRSPSLTSSSMKKMKKNYS